MFREGRVALQLGHDLAKDQLVELAHQSETLGDTDETRGLKQLAALADQTDEDFIPRRGVGPVRAQDRLCEQRHPVVVQRVAQCVDVFGRVTER